ncbi:23S rRNA pseudouridine(2604) synthase RluF [Flavobacterium sp. SE-s28]|uniref:Pseudouridine synthase n=1 Tax=Flavobacterium silvaticum TaxID=1852020 RepID=A0A972JIT8_9FLAO|nr:23S rRNA pseudouridine(2604) synthase RluF [Flavobacterium silvaticum]NMH29400.1 23S rRNA pseudouridine(2604) synthase RluF [Flavobacterium silvaticum]
MQKRLNKFLAETGRCSRREADVIITEGRVTVNGKPAEMGMQVSFEDEIRIDGKLVEERHEKPIYLAFNKPPGIECTTNQDVRNNIIDYINYPKRIFPIGRLDKASEGLIFLTDDGDIVNKILRARNNHEKEYIVTVNKPISNKFITRMGNGIPILDTVTRKCVVEQISEFVFRIILTQGLNRQIRRMCEYLDYEVEKLQRVRIINIKLDLPLGRHRELTDAEITELQTLIEPSSMTEEASLPKVETTRAKEFTKREPREKYPAKRDFKKPDSDAPKRNFSRNDTPRDASTPKDYIRPKRTENSDGSRPKFNRDEKPRDVSAPKDYSKPRRNEGDNDRQKFKRDESKPRDEQRPKTFTTPKRFEIIKKDDPRYKGKDEL